jgi:hypothetical protein
MFNFLKFVRLAVSIVSVILAVVLEIKKAVETHFANGAQTT